MNNEEFSDNSDSDDADFDPTQVNEEDVSDGSVEDYEEGAVAGASKRKAVTKKSSKKRKKRNAYPEEDEDEGVRINGHSSLEGDDHPQDEKVKQAEEEAKEKARTDVLWADFLNSVESEKKRKSSSNCQETIIVKKVYNFAGQRLEVEEEVKVVKSIPSAPTEKSSKPNATETGLAASTSKVSEQNNVSTSEIEDLKVRDRSHIPKYRKCFLGSNPDDIGLGADSKGLKSVVSALFSKNQKVNTLYKTKIDWKKYKQENNIDDELKSHRNSKNGYVDKQEFLQRTDLREFEKEREIRAHARRKNQNQR